MTCSFFFVIPAQAGTPLFFRSAPEGSGIPAFAGMTRGVADHG